jgi:hypothetical protein
MGARSKVREVHSVVYVPASDKVEGAWIRALLCIYVHICISTALVASQHLNAMIT